MSDTSQKVYDTLLNPYSVRRTLVTNGGVQEAVQHTRLDIGSGATESQVTAANPLPVTGTVTATVSALTGVTSNPTGRNLTALDTASFNFVWDEVTVFGWTVGSTASVLTAASHSAVRGDIIYCTAGDIVRQFAHVESVTATTATLSKPFSQAPSGFDLLMIWRPVPVQGSGNGEMHVTSTSLATEATLLDFHDRFFTPSVGGGGYVRLGLDTSVVANQTTQPTTTTNSLIVKDSNALADNAAFTDGTNRVFPAGFIFDEVAGTALTENDNAAARVDSKRAQVLTIEDATTRGQRAAVTRAADYDTNGIPATTVGLTVNARLHQCWDTGHADTAGGDDSFYAQNMDDNGNVCMNISSVKGVLTTAGNGAATTGSLRVALATGSTEVASIITALQLIDNPVNTDGSAIATSLFQVGGTDGTNAQIFKTDTNGELQVDVLSMPAVDTELPPAAALADNTANPTVPAVGAFNMVFDGTNWDRAQAVDVVTDGSAAGTKGIHVLGTDGTNAQIIKTDTDGNIQVDVLTMPSVTVTATDLDVKETRSATATRTQVADNAADVAILASNANRLGATIYNDSSALLYLGLGTTAASTTNYTARVYPNGYYEVPGNYTGEIRGIWATDPGDGAARVTELT